MSDQPITIDAATRLVASDRIKIDRRGGMEPIDFGRDHVLILCPRTGRPLATCLPIPGARLAPAPAPAPASPAPTRPAPAGDGGGNGGTGRLTDAQREWLVRAIRENRGAAPDKIGSMFERQYNRPIGVLTVKRYIDEAE